MRGLYTSVALGALGLAVVGATGAAQAALLVQNGGFSSLSPSNSPSTEFGPDQNLGNPNAVSNWAGEGYVFVFTTPTGPALTQFNPVTLSLDASTTDDTLAGGGGNFIGADPVFENPSGISQTITGLTFGDLYVLSFDYAGTQQVGYSGTTTEGWTGTIGGTAFGTGTSPLYTPLSVGTQGFSGWFNDTVTFTASGTSELLTFLATGGPTNTQPPFALLDNVSITQTTNVPEPMTLSMFGAGLAGLAGAVAFRRRKKAKLA